MADDPKQRKGGTGFGALSGIEIVAASVAAVALAGLAAIEPDIVGAPLQSQEASALTFGGGALALAVLVAMVRMRVPPPIRLAVLGVPFVAVTWWLLSPFFIDETVDEEFVVSIEEAAHGQQPPRTTPATTVLEGALEEPASAGDDAASSIVPPTTTRGGPALLGSGSFIGLAGHDGTGHAGVFRLEDGSQVLRLESFDIDNGPDLKIYLVPGADQTQPLEGYQNLGPLRGNVGDQTYEIPAGSELTSGPWTVLVWCEQFAVEFVAATLTVA